MAWSASSGGGGARARTRRGGCSTPSPDTSTPSRAYPAERHARVVLTLDNAPWHVGELLRAALARHPHLELYWLPSYSPQLNVIERVWKVLRAEVTHNRLFAHVQALAGALDRTIRRLARRRRPLLTLILSARQRAKSFAA
ncbi:MAG: transposase [Polyangiaceae bacterium]|jgi:transposase|nr:transposase [Polyangiaceae bacterium]